MSALADSIVPQMSLLDLPVELIREILLHTYGRDHGFQGGAERAIFRTRIAIEGTCRFLRYISARLPWTMSCGIVDFDSFGTLSMAGLVDRERRNDASELFFVTVPERLRTFPGINVTSLLPIDVAARWLERFYESKFGVEQSADPTADPLSPVVVKRLSCDCHVSFLPVLHRPWRLSCLEAHYGGRDGAMSPNELVGVVGNLAPSLKQFSLSFDEAFDEANNVESVIVGCLAALRTSSKGIEGISLRRDSDRRVSGITTVGYISST